MPDSDADIESELDRLTADLHRLPSHREAMKQIHRNHTRVHAALRKRYQAQETAERAEHQALRDAVAALQQQVAHQQQAITTLQQQVAVHQRELAALRTPRSTAPVPHQVVGATTVAKPPDLLREPSLMRQRPPLPPPPLQPEINMIRKPRIVIQGAQ